MLQNKKLLIGIGLLVASIILIIGFVLIKSDNTSTSVEDVSGTYEVKKLPDKVIKRTTQTVNAISKFLITDNHTQRERDSFVVRYGDNINSDFIVEMIEYYDEEYDINYLPITRSLDIKGYNLNDVDYKKMLSFKNDTIIHSLIFNFKHMTDEDKVAKGYYVFKFDNEGKLIDYTIDVNEHNVRELNVGDNDVE